MANLSFNRPKEIVDWLSSQPDQVRSGLSMRLGLRALPAGLDIFPAGRLGGNDSAAGCVVQLFRAGFVAWATTFHSLRLGSQNHAAASALSDAAIDWLQNRSAHNAMSAVHYSSLLVANAKGENLVGHLCEFLSRLGCNEFFDQQLHRDLAYFERAGLTAVMRSPLWKLSTSVETKVPEKLRTPFAKFMSSARVKVGPWKVWADWYNSIAESEDANSKGFGRANDAMIASLSSNFWMGQPDLVVGEVAGIAASAETSIDLLSEIPDQGPGPAFGISKDGLIDVRDSKLPSLEDQAEIAGIRDVLLEALSVLDAACARSNAFSSIASIVSAYKREASADLSALSIDRLYANGLRLENANSRLNLEIAKGDLPEQGLVVGEAIDSVIALHGSVVMGTARGRELLARAREFHQNALEVVEYKRLATKFAADIDRSQNIFENRAKALVVGLNNEIGEGRHPDRSTSLAQSTNANLLSTMGRAVVTNVLSATVAAGVLGSATGQLTAAEISVLTDKVAAFFVAHADGISAFAAAAGSDLSWITSFLAWLERHLKLPSK